MKKIIKTIIVGCLALSLLIPMTAFAAVGGEQVGLQDIQLTDKEFNSIISNNPNNSITTYATGLITSHSIGISASGTTLKIAGLTKGSADVSRCGFSKVIIQRKKASATSWSEYMDCGDFLKDSTSYTLSKSITVGTGYQYRVSVTHYAKKNIFSTQKIDATSNAVTI